jgi:RsiW-degrading membrane proteinase PrsW (M82 family)
MNDSEERQRKRREYERGQEELQLIAQEKKRALKKIWLNFAVLSLFIWVTYGVIPNNLKAEYLYIVTVLIIQILLVFWALLKRRNQNT